MVHSLQTCFCVVFKRTFLPVMLCANLWETCMQWAEMQKQRMGGTKRRENFLVFLAFFSPCPSRAWKISAIDDYDSSESPLLQADMETFHITEFLKAAVLPGVHWWRKLPLGAGYFWWAGAHLVLVPWMDWLGWGCLAGGCLPNALM